MFPLLALLTGLLLLWQAPAGDPPDSDVLGAKQAKIERMEARLAAKEGKMAESGFELTDWTILLPNWQVGDRRLFEVVSGRRTIGADGEPRGDSTLTVYRVIVTEADHDFYRTRWYPEEYYSTDSSSDLADVEIDEAELLKMEADGLLIRTTSIGQFVEVENASVYRDLLQRVVEKAVSRTADPVMQEEARARIERLGGGDWLMQKFVEPIILFYSMYAQDWPVDRSVPIESLFTVGSSGRGIQAVGTMQSSPAEDGGTFVVERSLAVDSDALRSAATFIHGSAEEAASMISMVDEDVFVIDAEEGWVVSIDRVRVVEAAEERQEYFLRLRTIQE